MFSVPTVHLDHNGLVTIEIGIHSRTAECLSPVSGESFGMEGVKTVAERMCDHVVRHHPTVPGIGKPAQAINAAYRVEESLHTSIMTILPCLHKVIRSRGGAFIVPSLTRRSRPRATALGYSNLDLLPPASRRASFAKPSFYTNWYP